MSIDVHPGSAPAFVDDIPLTADDDLDRGASWAETAITFAATVAAVGVVSFLTVLMAMA